jgi:biopolymer transport protein ExbD
MTWTVRHEGSPRTIEGLTLEQVLEGLLDGLWEPTDEVRGPGETAWLPLESHPATADTAGEVEPPSPHAYDEATNLDFNSLIDVVLVLLIFFILTTSYAALLKRLDMPSTSADQKLAGPAHITKEQVAQQMVKVTLKRSGDTTITTIEDGPPVAPANLEKELSRFRNGPKNILLMEYGANVPYGEVIRVRDVANKVRFNDILDLVPPGEAGP